MLRALFSLLLVVLIGYAGLMLFVYSIQDKMLYFPTTDLATSPAHHNLLFETVTLRTTDRETLHAWWIPAERERAVLLYCHGNAGNIADRLSTVEGFNRLGFSVLLFDYRGYGRSTGTPSEEGLYQDVEAAWTYLTRTRGVNPFELIVYGRSLGGAVATWLAEQHDVGVLIVEAAFTSIPDIAALHYPYLPVRFLARTRFDNLSRIDKVRAPLLLLHSPDDEIVPYAHGQRLYEAARQNKAFVEIAGGHNDSFLATGPRYWDEIDAFVRHHLGR